MMKKKFIQKYILIPVAVTFMFVAYCATSIATNDDLSTSLVSTIDQSIYEPVDELAFISEQKPELDFVEVASN